MADSWYQSIRKTQGKLDDMDRAGLLKDNLKDRMMAVIQDIKTEDVSWYNEIYMGVCATDAEVDTAVANGDFKKKDRDSIITFLNTATANYKYAHLLWPPYLHDKIRHADSCTCTGESFDTVPALWILNGRVYSFDPDMTENNAKTFGRITDVLSGEIENKHLDKLQLRGLRTALAVSNRKSQISSAKTTTIANVKNNAI